MKASEIKDKSLEELKELETELEDTLFRAKFKNSANQLKNTAEIKTLRKDIARVKTVLRSK